MIFSDSKCFATVDRVERRLAAILVADVAGYSRLMHVSEEATHARVTSLMTNRILPVIAEHGGHIIKHTGDGFLAKFQSAVDAVRSAMHDLVISSFGYSEGPQVELLLKEFDFIDIGAMLETSGAVPVVIKSLVFPTSSALGRVDAGKAG